MTAIEPGRTAYEARYAHTTLGPRGLGGPAWDDLPMDARAVWARVELAVREDIERLTLERDSLSEHVHNLMLAFFVLAESGHGGAIYDVKSWAKSGFRGPIPCTAGSLFRQWAADNSIAIVNGCMRFNLASGDSRTAEASGE